MVNEDMRKLWSDTFDPQLTYCAIDVDHAMTTQINDMYCMSPI